MPSSLLSRAVHSFLFFIQAVWEKFRAAAKQMGWFYPLQRDKIGAEYWATFFEEGRRWRLEVKHKHLDMRALRALTSRIRAFQLSRLGRVEIEKLSLRTSSFQNEQAIRQMLEVMVLIGDELKTLSLENYCVPDLRIPATIPLSLICGLPEVKSLRCLRFFCGVLCGSETGNGIQTVLRSKLTNIQTLELAHCTLDDSMYHGLVDGVRHHRLGMDRLTLRCCQLLDAQIVLLVDALGQSRSRDTLERIDISENRLTLISLSNMARLLNGCTSLKDINLRWCQELLTLPSPRVGSNRDANYLESARCFDQFAKALSTNTSLKSLDLRWCNVTEEWATSLLRVLERNSTLRSLDILDGRGGEIGERLGHPVISHYRSLVRSLPKISGLAKLSANIISFGSRSGERSLVSALAANQSLTEISSLTERCSFQRDGGQPDITAILRRNWRRKMYSSLLRHKSKLCERAWPSLLVRLMTMRRDGCSDMSAVFQFFIAMAPEIAACPRTRANLPPATECVGQWRRAEA